MGALIEVGVLGPLEVQVDGRPVSLGGARTRLLFCRLLAERGQVVPDWRLREDVWGGHEGSDAVLKVGISRLRAALGPAADAVRRERRGYLLVRTDVVGDEDRFDALVAEARIARDPLAAADLYARSLSLWRGEPFADLDAPDALRAVCDRLRRQRDLADFERIQALLAAGRHRELVPDLEAAAAARPEREPLAMSLALALYRCGHQVEALAALHRTERHLRTEFGVSPGEPFRALEHALLTHDASIAAPAARPTGDGADGDRLRREVEVSARAADALVTAGAPAEAVRLATRACDAARELGDAPTVVRCLARLGRILSLAERGDEVDPLLDEAAELARRAGDAAGLAHVALTRFGRGLVGDDPDSLLALLAEPLAVLAPDAPECIDLLCAAMHQLVYTADSPSADALLGRAELLADRTGDPRALAVARAARAVLAPLRGVPVAEQQAAARAAIEAAEVSGDANLRVVALHGRARALLEAGRVDDVASLLDEFAFAARQSQFPFAWIRIHLLAHAVDLARGDLDGLSDRVLATLATGRRMGVASVGGTTLVQLATVWSEEARYPELLAMLAPRVAAGTSPGWEAFHAWLQAQVGDADEARRAVRAVLGRPWPRAVARERPYVLAFAAEAAAVLGEPADAGAAADALADQAGRFLVLGHATSTYGPADRARGVALSAAGRHDEAVLALDAARSLAAAGGAVLWADRSALDLAGALAARGEAVDVERARVLVDQVRRSPCVVASARLAGELARVDAAVSRPSSRPGG